MLRKLILRCHQSPGDVVMMTVAIRDLHLAYPGRFQTDIRGSAVELFQNSPYITPLCEGDFDVEVIDMYYPLINHSNQIPLHFVHAYPMYLADKIGLPIPVTAFKGDIHLSDQEKVLSKAEFAVLGVPDNFWIINAGGKHDFTAKWWNPANYQKVVDHFRGRIAFVQVGELQQGHFNKPLVGVIDLLGKTSVRQFVRLMHRARGAVCGVTFTMHLAAAVEVAQSPPLNRPCVVIAGGREPAQWEQYPHHQYLNTNGMLSCCDNGGCWKSRCQLMGDGDEKDGINFYLQPVQVTRELRIPRCMEMITPTDVIRKIEM